MGAPHRSAEPAERCHACDAIATATCVRCARPCCADHAPARRRRCDACEAELDRRLAVVEADRVDLQGTHKRAYRAAGCGGVLIGLLAAIRVALAGAGAFEIAALTAVMILAGFLTTLVVAMGWSIAGQPGLGQTRRLVTRTRFLRERPGRRLLPEPGP